MSKQGQAGVYELYKLNLKDSQTFSTEFKTLQRPLHVVTHEYAEGINLFSTKNGLLYVYNEEASKLYWAGKPYKKEIKPKKEYANFEDIEVNGEQVIEGKSLEDLRLEYEDLSNKKPNALWKEKKIQEEINKLKQ